MPVEESIKFKTFNGICGDERKCALANGKPSILLLKYVD